MRVRDLSEPLRLGYVGEDPVGERSRAVHYAEGAGGGALCGHDPNLAPLYSYDDVPNWVLDDDVCGQCRIVAVGLLRWWHPRATLPDWTYRTTPTPEANQ